MQEPRKRTYPPYRDMTKTQLLARLNQRERAGEITANERIALIEEHAARKKDKKRASAKRAASRPGWRLLMFPLMWELTSVKQSIRYYRRTGKTAAEWAALSAYLSVLNDLNVRLKAYRGQLKSVTEAREAFENHPDRGRAAGSPLPNGGTHWVDWIAPATKRRIMMQFADLPSRKGAQRDPFARLFTTHESVIAPAPAPAPTRRRSLFDDIDPSVFDEDDDVQPQGEKP